MCIITISEEAFSGGEKFARTLAQRLGLRYVDSTILVERAAAWGGNQEKLQAAFESAPTFFERFTRNRQIQTVLLRAALAEDVRDGNAVCYGIAADLLSLDTRQILRIDIKTSHRFRRLQVQQCLKFQGAEAERHLNECDRKRRRWLAYLFGAKRELPMGFDLVINPEQMSLDAAYTAVFEMVLNRSRFGTADAPAFENFAVSTRIKAALALHPDTAHLDMEVEIHDDTAVLHGVVRSLEEIDAIERVPLPIPSNMKIDCTQIELGSWDFVPSVFSNGPAKPHPGNGLARRGFVMFRPAWIAAPVLLMLFLIVGGSWIRGRWFHPAYTHLLSVSGVITDSQCGVSHSVIQQTAECVRSCVRASGAKYVLNDGTHNFVLTDQQTGERFAAQRVVATGLVDEITGDLQLRSIQAVAR